MILGHIIVVSISKYVQWKQKYWVERLRLAVATLLNSKVGQAALLCGICCGSFVTINMATSGRHIAHPLGRDDRGYVNMANCMASRLFNCNFGWPFDSYKVFMYGYVSKWGALSMAYTKAYVDRGKGHLILRHISCIILLFIHIHTQQVFCGYMEFDRSGAYCFIAWCIFIYMC